MLITTNGGGFARLSVCLERSVLADDVRLDRIKHGNVQAVLNDGTFMEKEIKKRQWNIFLNKLRAG